MLFTVRMDRLHRLKRFALDRKGSTAVAMAVLTPIMIAGLAFGSEVGYWELTKRRLQNAADTAAFAAATQLRSGLDQPDFEQAALTVANDSGFTFALEGNPDPDATGALLVESPPTQGGYVGDDDAIMVSVDTTVERRFTKLFLENDISITAFATAQVRNPRPACVLSLDPTASGALSVEGSANVTLTGCDMAANSISSTAVLTEGTSANATTDCVSTVGQVSDGGSVFNYTDCAEPIEHAPVTADPYKDVPEPASCASYDPVGQFGSGNPANEDPGCWGKAACSPCATLNIAQEVNLSPGTYVFKNVDIKVDGNGKLDGEEVTLYLEGSSTITLIGNGTIDISAPLSGPLQGLAIFGDRDNAGDFDITGNLGASIVGAIYSPNSNITFTGDSSNFTAGECTQVIGGTVTFDGNAEFDTDCTNSGTRQIVTALSISLVE